MTSAPKIALLGIGNMGEALLKGLLRAGTVKAEQVVATDARQERLDAMRTLYGVAVSQDNVRAVKEADVVLLSVKPQGMAALAAEIAPVVTPQKLLLSVAAGVPIAALERSFGRGARIIRAMPNTPALVGEGATAISGGEHATQADLALATDFFRAVGSVVTVEEAQLDAVTGLSGSGPAYIFLIIEALSDAGVKVGLPRYTALELAAQTVLGSARLLLETGSHPGVLKDQVTSPGGTAIAGLHTLEAGGLRTTLMDAVEAATFRSRELGEAYLEKG